MTRSGLAERGAKKGKTSASQAELVVETILDCMNTAFQRGERVEVRGLGTFQVRSYKGYKGRNPKTGQAINVQPKRLPVFRVGRGLAARVAEQQPAQPNRRLSRE
jgi:integration host factor subunit beta